MWFGSVNRFAFASRLKFTGHAHKSEQLHVNKWEFLNTEYLCICCNHLFLVTVKWLTNALRSCSNESVRMNNSFASRTAVMNTASVVLRVYQMEDGQPRDPRYILMTFTEISTALRSTNMWNIFESSTFHIFVQDLQLTIFNSTNSNSIY